MGVLYILLSVRVHCDRSGDPPRHPQNSGTFSFSGSSEVRRGGGSDKGGAPNGAGGGGGWGGNGHRHRHQQAAETRDRRRRRFVGPGGCVGGEGEEGFRRRAVGTPPREGRGHSGGGGSSRQFKRIPRNAQRGTTWCVLQKKNMATTFSDMKQCRKFVVCFQTREEVVTLY